MQPRDVLHPIDDYGAVIVQYKWMLFRLCREKTNKLMPPTFQFRLTLLWKKKNDFLATKRLVGDYEESKQVRLKSCHCCTRFFNVPSLGFQHTWFWVLLIANICNVWRRYTKHIVLHKEYVIDNTQSCIDSSFRHQVVTLAQNALPYIVDFSTNRPHRSVWKSNGPH